MRTIPLSSESSRTVPGQSWRLGVSRVSQTPADIKMAESVETPQTPRLSFVQVCVCVCMCRVLWGMVGVYMVSVCVVCVHRVCVRRVCVCRVCTVCVY